MTVSCFVLFLCLLQLHSCTPFLQAPFGGTNCVPILLPQRNTWKLLPGDSQAVTSVIAVLCTQTSPKFKEWGLNLWFIRLQICQNTAEVGQPSFPSALQACVGGPDVEIQRYNKDTSWLPYKPHTGKESASSVCSGGNLHPYSLTAA